MKRNLPGMLRHRVRRLVLALTPLLGLTGLSYTAPARATSGLIDMPREQGLFCRRAIQQAEAGNGMPPKLLVSIARVESGRLDPTSGRFHPWPWTINAEGKGYFFQTKGEAIAFARRLQERGVRSFDVGCMQVNMMYHASAFQDLEEAFDPAANVRYAVKFLGELKEKSGTWEAASAWYHSANPAYGIPYRGMVVSAMAVENKNPTEYASLANPEGASVSIGRYGTMSAMRSMPTGPGTVTYLAGGGGHILSHSYPSFANGGFPAMPQGAVQASGGVSNLTMPGGFGRSLDGYRRQPVAMVSPRLVAAR